MFNDNFSLNNAKYIKCIHCIETCHAKLIVKDSTDNINFRDDIETNCIYCGQCYAVCPLNAIIIPTRTKEVKKQKIGNIAFNKLSSFLKSRRSIRTYKEKELSKNQIEELLDTARYAPSGANTQLVQWEIFSGK